MNSGTELPANARAATAHILLESLPSVMGYVTSELRRSAAVDNPVHFRLLRTLRRGSRTLHDLAELHSVRLPTMSRTVSVMEGHGWLRRRRSTEDRRTVFVELTPAGEEALGAVEEMAIRRASNLLNCLSDEENEALHTGLGALYRVVQEQLGVRYEERPTGFRSESP
jgi:DNA-binding MarR family transcriptional regulator